MNTGSFAAEESRVASLMSDVKAFSSERHSHEFSLDSPPHGHEPRSRILSPLGGD